MVLISYSELIKIPAIFFLTMGQEIQEPRPNQLLQSKLLRVLLYAGYINYNTQWGLQIIFFIVMIRSSSILEATAVGPLVGFGFVGNFKQATLYRNKLIIRGILKDLEDMFPNTVQLQKDYNLKRYIETLKPMMIIYATLCLLNTVYFGLFPLIQSVISVVYHGAEFDYPQGFPVWYPFDLSQYWVLYILAYSLQMWAGYLTGVALLTADLLLVSSVTQLSMYFDYITKSLEQYEPKSTEEDHKFLNKILYQHIKCLELSRSVDTVFSLSLLLNFLTSSFTICFVGFQVITASTEVIIRYCLLLVTALVQVMVICIYGNMLIDSSQAVGEAAFGHPWYNGDLAYRKKVALVICRSQKFAAIHAPTFPPISLETFMKVISMSYQFFAVLQTTHDKE